MYEFEVSDNCPRCGWRVTTAYVMASSKDEAKTLLENDVWLCGRCMSNFIVDEGFVLKQGDEHG